MAEIVNLFEKPDPDRAFKYFKEQLGDGGINCAFMVGLDEDDDPFVITGFTELEINDAFAVAGQLPFLLYENAEKEVMSESIDE